MEEDILPDEPERYAVIARNDQMAMILAAELIENALAVKDAFGESKILDAHNALADVIATAAQLMKGPTFFHPVIRVADITHLPGDINPMSLREYYKEGQIQEAHDELHEIIASSAELMKCFTYDTAANIE